MDFQTTCGTYNVYINFILGRFLSIKIKILYKMLYLKYIKHCIACIKINKITIEHDIFNIGLLHLK